MKQTKRRRLERKILKLENDFRKNDSHELFKAVRELEGKPRKSLMAVKNKDGEKTTRTEEVLKIWKNHFYEHLNTEFPRDESAIQNLPKIVTNLESSDDLTITRDEIRKAVSSLKNNKVPGADAITAEVLKAGGEPVVAMLEWIFKRILAEQDTPKHFAKMLLTPILKKVIKTTRQTTD